MDFEFSTIHRSPITRLRDATARQAHHLGRVGALLLFAFLSTALIAAQYFAPNGAIITVTSTADSGPGSLRQALADANGGDTIQFHPSLNGQTITLTTAELFINRSITINGPGADLLSVARSTATGTPQFRIFHISPSRTVAIQSITIRGGALPFGSSSGGGVFNNQSTLTIDHCTVSNNHGGSEGGGVSNTGTLNIAHSLISNNTSEFAGGGISNNGSLTITDSTVSNNNTTISGHFGGNGGGIRHAGSELLTIYNCTINGNVASGNGSASSIGGGISCNGPLVIIGSTVSGNSAFFSGGGIYQIGTTTIRSSTISQNSARYSGAGIYSGANLTITDSTVSGNQLNLNFFNYGFGGGIHHAGGTLTILNSILNDNRADGGDQASEGGGIYSHGSGLSISNSTFSGNFARINGGAIGNESPLTITNCTFSNNSSNGTAGGILNGGSPTLHIGNTILKTGASGANIASEGGTVTSHGYNLSSDKGGGFLIGPGDQIDTDPMLGPLQNNGGPTFTHALLPGSPAIDMGDPNFTPPPFTDQRGYARVYNERIDIGSLEVQPTPTPPGIVLFSRLSDARASAQGPGPGPNPNPSPEIQTDFLPASLSNTAMSYGEPGAADSRCTSNSQIVVDNQMGTLEITGDGEAWAGVGVPGAFVFYAWASAKLIVINFTLTDRSYAYSLTGQLSANGETSGFGHPNLATAKLTRGGVPIFEVIADDSTVPLSETGILQPDNYTLAVDVDAYAGGLPNSAHSSANFNFALGPAPTPTPGIVLVSRLSDARAFALGGSGVVDPPPRIQTDFLPALLSNTANSSGEPGFASSNCTSNSQIDLDNQIGTLQIAGDGGAGAQAFGAATSFYAWASAKLIVINFTLTDRSYAYSLTGQLSADEGTSGHQHSNLATAKLTRGSVTIFEVIADDSTVTLSETGILQPDNYTLAVDVDAYAIAPQSFGSSSANFNFALGPTPTPTPTATATATATASPTPTATATTTPTSGMSPTPTATATISATPTPTPSLTPSTSQLLNISTRLHVGTGSNVGIGGFIINGAGNLQVVVRGLGPSLGQLGLPDPLVDPVVEIRDSTGALLLQNDNWQDDPVPAGQLTKLGLAPTQPAESALIIALPPGAYTPIVSGKNGGTGLGLIEVYNVDRSVPVADIDLANINTRGLVQTGNNVMIGGFILSGNTDNAIALRGIGPSLTEFGVPNALADPTLELRDSNGALLITNDDWQDDPTGTTPAQLAAHGLALSDPNESGIFVILPPGAFTAILAGKNGGTGVGLVEIYNVQ